MQPVSVLDDRLVRDIERLPVPSEDVWVPTQIHRRPRPFIMALGIFAALLVGVVVGDTLLSARSTLASRANRGPASETSPLPSANARFGYVLLLPSGWRPSEAERTLASEAVLLERQVFTARSVADESRFVGSQFLPWDLFAEVWDGGNKSPEEWARRWCSDPCDVLLSSANGAREAIASVQSPMPGRVYVFQHGSTVLVLRYGLGDNTNRPTAVTE